ncbi:hypothetical protein SLA2020_065740 [Shorea laevis]
MRTGFATGTFLLHSLALLLPSFQFESNELLLDDEEFCLEGAPPRFPEPASIPAATGSSRKRHSESESDPKIQFSLGHAFGDSDFVPASTFSARLKAWNHGGQTLTKLRFSRNGFTDEEKEKFKNLLQGDDFYKIRLPSNVLSPPGRDYIISSVKARCLPWEGLDEHFVIHMEGVNILAVNYGSPGACPCPRRSLGHFEVAVSNIVPCTIPFKWAFKSHTVLKNSEQAPRAPIFTEEVLGGENGEGEVVQPPERSFWAKYWMYLIPLGLIVINAITQAMNMPEERATGQSASQAQLAAAMQRASNAAVRRR